MNKQEVLDIIDHLPEQIDPEQLMTELYLRAKLDRAEVAVARGEVVSQEEVVQRSRQWFRTKEENGQQYNCRPNGVWPATKRAICFSQDYERKSRPVNVAS